MPQFERLGQLSGALLRSPMHRENICRALSLFGIGIAKKTFIADQLAPFVARGYDSAGALGFVDAWLLSLSYSFQLYFDFSGYSDMAVAMSLLFGVMLPFNFDSPYRMPAVVAIAITFPFVNATWVFFRAPDLAAALKVLLAMATPGGTSAVLPSFLWGMLAFAGILVWAAPASQRLALNTKAGAPPSLRYLPGPLFSWQSWRKTRRHRRLSFTSIFDP
jgi:D-alanyl-lipoteichoic acid acyltransferase DltB (MBOAT superfamily)